MLKGTSIVISICLIVKLGHGRADEQKVIHTRSSVKTKQNTFEESVQRVKRQLNVPFANQNRFTLDPDVIFLFQRAGISEEDFNEIKTFLNTIVASLPRISTSPFGSSRVGVVFFTHTLRHAIDVETCCSRGRNSLLQQIADLRLDSQDVYEENYQGAYMNITPHIINVTEAFRFLQKRYLNDGQPRTKPTLVIFVANFQSPYASFRLLLEAGQTIEETKGTGARLAAIIVDPLRNRQPRRMQENDLWLSRDSMNVRQDVESRDQIKRQVPDNSTSGSGLLTDSVPENLIHLTNTLTAEQRHFLRLLEQIHNEQTSTRMEYQNLAQLYAQVLASLRQLGVKVSSYGDLLQIDLIQLLAQQLNNTASWYGEANINSTCRNTQNQIDSALWSPGFFAGVSYPSNAYCRWRITARSQFRIGLRFDFLSTEESFDFITVYDGFQEDSLEILARYSGNYQGQNLPSVNSTEEQMTITFRSDAAAGDFGFHAFWSTFPKMDKIDGAKVVFLVDVSASISPTSFDTMKSYLTRIVKYFYLQDDFYQDEKYEIISPEEREQLSTKFGLLSFDDKTKIVNGIEETKTRRNLFESVNRIFYSMADTYIGRALDFTRLQQFYAFKDDVTATRPILDPMSSESSETIPRRSDIIGIPRKAVFLFTDAQSIDDPGPAARRLCHNNIIPIVIGVGRVSKNGVERIRNYCGFYYGIDAPISEVIITLKYKFGILPSKFVPLLPPLPTRPPFPNRTLFTTIPTPPPIYILGVRSTAGRPHPVCYWCVTIALAVIGLLEFLVWFSIVCLGSCCSVSRYTRPSDSVEFLQVVTENKKLKYPTTANSFFERHATSKA